MNSSARIWARALGLFLAVCLASGMQARAQIAVFTQPPYASGGQFKSSWYAPDGLDDDSMVWDAFTLASATAITEVRWRGAYTNYLSGAGLAPVYNFTIAIYKSIGAGTEPDVVSGQLVRYYAGNNAGEVGAGTAGGVGMYDYHFVLPSPFQAAAGTKHWLQIIAWQGLTPIGWRPDWSWARGTGGENSHFRRVGGTGGSFASITGDCVFTLMASGAPTAVISGAVQPSGAGTVSGAGAYPIGSVASLTASPNAGFGFVNWTEGATQVSTNAHYTFTVGVDRTLTANFVPAYSVMTGSWPVYGGTTTGGGIYNEGATVTVTATPAHGFVFAGWTEYGSPVSSSATYTFSATSATDLVANFENAPRTVTFDFDDAPVHTSLPVSLTSGPLGATFSATAQGFSIQAVGTVGIAPAGMSGLYVYPNSVFAADLVADFSETLTDFSIMFAPHELACDTSARMRVTAFMNGVQAGTNTATAPVPGTWPSGTLSIAVPTGFNRAVVHYDAPGTGCQDCGPIFVADNVTATMKCVAATVSQPPSAAIACGTGSADFWVTEGGTGPFTYQWQVQTAPGVWQTLGNDPAPLPCGGSASAYATPVGSSVVSIGIRPCPGGTGGPQQFQIHCIVSNECGSATSGAATYTICAADFSCGGGVTIDDLFLYFNAYFLGVPAADFNGVGGVTIDDLFLYINAYFVGC